MKTTNGSHEDFVKTKRGTMSKRFATSALENLQKNEVEFSKPKLKVNVSVCLQQKPLNTVAWDRKHADRDTGTLSSLRDLFM
jgi:hypothetical protein